MKKNYILSFLLTMFLGALAINAQSETVINNPTDGAIPDNDPAGVNFTLTVTNNFVMTDVDVHVIADHTWIGDLIFEITSPAGTTVRIIDRPGVPNSNFGCSSNGPNVTLDDNAINPIETACLTSNDTISGTYSPNNPLSAFNGENSAGTWTLWVSDNALGNTGSLLTWGITYNYGVCVSRDFTTPISSNNNFAGNMFDLTASGGRDIFIEKFDIKIGTGSANISVFSRPGSYVGFENNPAGWTLMGNETVTGQGGGMPTELNVGGLTIPEGDTYGIYITITNYYPAVAMLYTNGDNVFSDSYLTITTGVGKGNPDFTGSTFQSRSWNGTVYYCISGTPPPNDLIQNAISVTSESQPYTDPDVSLQFATYEPFNPDGCEISGINGVWYSFTAEINGTAEALLTSPEGYSTVVFYEAPSENVGNETELTFLSDPNNPCASSTASSIPTIAGQSYYIFVVNTNGPSDVVIDISNSLGVNDNTIDRFVIFPNPANNVLNLSSNINIDDISVYNMIGQKVLSQTIGTTKSQVDVSGLSTGTYLIKVNAEGQTAAYQFVKK